MKNILLHVRLLLVAVTLSLFSGCATEQDTDIPWNSPQPWEGSPTIPGLPTYR